MGYAPDRTSRSAMASPSRREQWRGRRSRPAPTGSSSSTLTRPASPTSTTCRSRRSTPPVCSRSRSRPTSRTRCSSRPTRGAIRIAETVRDAYGTGETDYFEKHRDRDTGEIEVSPSDAHVEGRDVVVVDDIVATGSTMSESVVRAERPRRGAGARGLRPPHARGQRRDEAPRRRRRPYRRQRHARTRLQRRRASRPFSPTRSTDSIRFYSISNHPRRVPADDDDAVRHVVRDDRARADHRASPPTVTPG